MIIACIIDSLNSGGAQRQMVNLVVLLKSSGHNVSLITYYPLNHFKNILETNEINHICINSRNKIDRILKIRNEVRILKANILISFLDIPSVIAQIISLPCSPWKTIVSERVVEIGKASRMRRFSRNLYRFTNAITVNSNENKKYIEQKAPWAKKKTYVIYNSVDLEKFTPNFHKNFGHNRIIVVASFRSVKNPIGLINAINLFRVKRPEITFQLDWYGHKNLNVGEKTSVVYENAIKRISTLHLENFIKLNDPIDNIEDEYNKSTVLVLPSFTEGLPNVVCEAMACGLPVLISNVADAIQLVDEGINGYLFDPKSDESIANTLVKFFDLNYDERLLLGINSRKKAEQLFSPQKYLNRYLDVINEII